MLNKKKLLILFSLVKFEGYSTVCHHTHVVLNLEHYTKLFPEICMFVVLSSTILFHVFMVVTMKIISSGVGCCVIGRWVLAFESSLLLPSSSSQLVGAPGSFQMLLHNYHHMLGEDYFHAC